jgi:hypothetical protein
LLIAFIERNRMKLVKQDWRKEKHK